MKKVGSGLKLPDHETKDSSYFLIGTFKESLILLKYNLIDKRNYIFLILRIVEYSLLVQDLAKSKHWDIGKSAFVYIST